MTAPTSRCSQGAGLVEGTARPGGGGNIAIAAHRDSFFRGLRDVAYGDLIELESFQRKATYRVSALAVVEPDDVQVLAETGEAALTLVTCYPFHFVGHAPQRFIVRAVATDLTPPVSRR
ncbi:MAG: class D sortase [Ahniella sp.]|nr:class D sortase [Ahniella sp.]